ncbi:ribose-phosphate diphosphokinase [Mycoplasma putrefaciens]|uniref:Ribose-phosphate pyrophosphokinase n=1 Tax=Mycoplasma putrefaciens Mput9231 TaxID=1292033 RepID=M9WE73_9MOLU|nr:ribose-phosphate pyrophosphokinase [Mycoplasma putrefaciens]AGJ91101.1 Ribose-phosphate pyrophosphokinase [Mycoplasma putrefaciens Mput9231]
MNNKDIYIFGLSAGQKLAKEVCDILGIEQKQAKTTKFADGEIIVESVDSVRGKKIYVIQSTSTPVNENLMELLIAIDAFKRGSAEKINVVIPYYGYARQDRKAKGRQPITSKLVADLLTKAGADRVIVFDIHSPQTMGFFDIPMDNFQTSQILANEIVDTIINEGFDREKCILVSPDYGGLNRVHKVDSYTTNMTNGIAVIGKRRPEPNKAEIEFILGDIQDKICFIIDDMIDTGGTIISGAKALKDNGAKDVYIFACHGLFNGPARERMVQAIKQGIVKNVVVTNTIEISEEKKFDGLKIVSVASLLADMIKTSQDHNSLTEVYNKNKDQIRSKIEKFIEKAN